MQETGNEVYIKELGNNLWNKLGTECQGTEEVTYKENWEGFRQKMWSE